MSFNLKVVVKEMRKLFLFLTVALLALAPALGGQLLDLAPGTAFIAASAVALLAAISALTLERSIPTSMRLTPRPQRADLAASTRRE